MTDEPVSEEPVIVATETTVEKGVELTKTAAYVARLDGTFDEFALADISLAKQVAGILSNAYPGYPWKVMSEIRQGFVAFQLPELMGPTLHAFIRLADWSNLNAKLILDTAGEMLERIDLPRGRCDMALYNEAKQRMATFDFADVGKKRIH